MQKGEYVNRARGKVSGLKEAWKWIAKRPDPKGAPCPVMQTALEEGLENLSESSGGAAHDELNRRVYQLVSLSIEGHRGVHFALKALGDAFIEEVSSRRKSASLAGEATGTVRTPEEARREVSRSIVGRVQLMIGELSQPHMVEAGLSEGAEACSCWIEPEEDEDGGLLTGQGRAQDPFTYELTDLGNAQQLIDLADGRLLWVPAFERWYVYGEDGCWSSPDNNAALELARRIAPRVKRAAEQRYRAAEGADTSEANAVKNGTGKSDAEMLIGQAKRLQMWAERCGSVGALTAMEKVLKTFPEMLAGAETFDADERLLHVGDGSVVVLGAGGVEVRPGTLADRVTRVTGAPYDPGARSPLWEDYLDTFVPDLDVRWFLQRLLGYSLLGGNPERVICFLHGPTSSGKSTVVEAASAAVGTYGGAFSLSVFREKQDESPRPDLVRILDQRVAFTSEAGSDWYLHADQLKRLSGGDSIIARTLHSRVYVEKIPAMTPFIATNSVPTVLHADEALLRRRFIAIPFDHQVFGDGDDTTARDRLRRDPDALKAVLAWMIDGYVGYCKEGLGNRPPAVIARTREFGTEVSVNHSWLEECCELGSEFEVMVDDLVANYKMWCATNGVDKPLGTQALGHFLTAQGVGKRERRRVDGVNHSFRPGIKLRNGGS